MLQIPKIKHRHFVTRIRLVILAQLRKRRPLPCQLFLQLLVLKQVLFMLWKVPELVFDDGVLDVFVVELIRVVLAVLFVHERINNLLVHPQVVF